MRKTTIPAILLSAILISGCTTMLGLNEMRSYPRDTAVIVNDVKYLISPIKCLEIRGISKNGTLDCYAIDGSQSAPVKPADKIQIRITESNFGLWASQDHQQWLYHFHHGGGKQQIDAEMTAAANNLVSSINATKSILDSIETSEQMSEAGAKRKLDGIAAYQTGGMSAWQAHQARSVQWHLNNSKYFSNKLQ